MLFSCDASSTGAAAAAAAAAVAAVLFFSFCFLFFLIDACCGNFVYSFRVVWYHSRKNLARTHTHIRIKLFAFLNQPHKHHTIWLITSTTHDLLFTDE